MRCKVGDLAVIVSNAPSHAGWLVRILSVPPRGSDFKLPDGVNHNQTVTDWLIESLSGEMVTPFWTGSKRTTRLARYGCINDKWLRPIRDNDGQDEALTWAGKPVKEPA